MKRWLKEKLGRLLRRWADRLIPPPVFPGYIAPMQLPPRPIMTFTARMMRPELHYKESRPHLARELARRIADEMVEKGYVFFSEEAVPHHQEGVQIIYSAEIFATKPIERC